MHGLSLVSFTSNCGVLTDIFGLIRRPLGPQANETDLSLSKPRLHLATHTHTYTHSLTKLIVVVNRPDLVIKVHW